MSWYKQTCSIMGYRFHPTHTEVVKYLLGFARNDPLPKQNKLMQEVDLYGDKEAWQIFEGDHTNTHYCITQLKKKKADSIRTERSVGKGKWNLQSKAKQVFDHNGRLMGYVKSLKYIPRTAHKSSIKAAYGEWLMTEYSLRYSYLNDIKKKGYVICKIKKKKKNDSDKQKGVANDDQNMSDIEEYIDSILKEENNENIEYIEGEEVGEHFLATLGCHDDLPVNNRHELALAGGIDLDDIDFVL
ncbi:NAC domain-containing protein 30-like [Capsicum annuum]|uniref:NAC domain-containing protein 30-like n=1 Tax=Capsicum annuum TaxID=4072 RepID=UPI001FB16282|nr:NAC domain-containing protein 30-like [Capsicum annuum]